MIRLRLTLGNAGVFALAFLLLGTIVYYTTSVMIFAAVDRDLSTRASNMPPFGFGRGPMMGMGPGGRFGVGGFEGHGPPKEFGRQGRRDVMIGGGFFNGPPPGEMFGPPPRQPGFQDSRNPQGTSASSIKPFLNSFDPAQARRLQDNFELTRPRFFRKDKMPTGPPNEQPFDAASLTYGLAGQTLISDVNFHGHHLRVLSAPIKEDGRIVGCMQVAAILDELNSALLRLKTILMALFPISLILTTLLGVWLTRRALRPVLDIAEAAQRIEANSMSERLPVQGHDEFSELSGRFNSMLDRVEGSFQQLTTAYEAQRRFISDASHELKTPLTTIKGRVGVALASSQTTDRYIAHLQAIGRASDTMNSIIQDLLLLARSDEAKLKIQREPHLFRKLATDASAMATAAHPAGIDIEGADDLQVCVDGALFTRALVNLLSNSIRHSPPENRILLCAFRRGKRILVQVIDHGEGIPAEHLPHIFDRFHRVDSSRDRSSGGTGLGLSIVRSIVEAHSGTVKIASEAGAGTTVTIELPGEE